MYLAIFTQFFFCDFHTVFRASHKSQRTSCIFIFFKNYFIFSRMILQNFRTKGTFSNSRSFPGPMSIFSRSVRTLYIRACLISYAIICGYMLCHGMPLTVFIHCDLDLRSQFLKTCTHSRSPILFMVAFHIWFVDTSWTLAIYLLFPGHCDLDLWFQF